MKLPLLTLLAISTSLGFAQCEDFIYNLNTGDPWCHDSENGFITVLAEGGTEPYTFDIRNDMDELVNLGGSNEALDLGSGTYSIYVVDSEGCELEGDVNLFAPEALMWVEFMSSWDDEFGWGNISMAATGGTGSLSYTWFTYEMDVIGASTSYGGLDPGCYIGQVIDDNGCILQDTTCFGATAIGENVLIQPLIKYSAVNNVLTIEAFSDGMVRLYAIDGSLLGAFSIKKGNNMFELNQTQVIYFYQITERNGQIHAGRVGN